MSEVGWFLIPLSTPMVVLAITLILQRWEDIVLPSADRSRPVRDETRVASAVGGGSAAARPPDESPVSVLGPRT
ncbi:hypothetical protein GCM10009754_41600 [Amycolatopsis minnesotensis]|uniref:Uncharacterized protein n=1 Tax=Amycolatopsis minnesotensis TaxID=337894 RepID=A0ABP5CMK7_9PSEU